MSRKQTRNLDRSFHPPRLLGSTALVAIGILLTSSCVQTWLSTEDLATCFVSFQTWSMMVGAARRPSFAPVATVVAVAAILTWIAGSLWITRSTGLSIVVAMTHLGFYGSIWWCLVGLWEWLWVAAGMVGWASLSSALALAPQFWLAFCLSGWITTLFCLAANARDEARTSSAVAGGSRLNGRLSTNLKDDVDTKTSSPSESEGAATRANPQAGQPGYGLSRYVWVACALYLIIFTTMNWRLYFNLLIPHGDSAMYEEHLWNVLHGKGFRSYLDQGLFLGEHIQIVHLFLIPLYIFWPSHLLLEFCESAALAFGALPVFWMVRRQTQSDQAALAAAIAYLLYAPMQYLDIEIDLKTFRPEAFGIPLLLLTLDQLDRRNLIGFLVGVAMTLTVKEDYAIIFGPLGVWIAVFGGRALLPVGSALIPANTNSNADGQECPSSSKRTWIIVGIALAVFSVAYLWLATRVVMPWFRSGVEVHYVAYFKKLGKTPEEIVWNVFTKPNLWFDDLVSISTFLYAIAMLAPVAFLPLCSCWRLAVGAPLFAILCLNELARDPRHHFHAPLVAIVFWAVAGGLPQAARLLKRVSIWLRFRVESIETTISVLLRTLLWSSSLATGLFFSLGPLGLTFWDPGSSWHWSKLYGASRRAEMFIHVPPLIPITSRVASTDFVHPRFTHHERSYDYSAYARKVSSYSVEIRPDKLMKYDITFDDVAAAVRLANLDVTGGQIDASRSSLSIRTLGEEQRGVDLNRIIVRSLPDGRTVYLSDVADIKLQVPDDTDFIVIDTQHRYNLTSSNPILRPEDVPEYRDHPDQWELLPDETEGYFIVLKRRR